MRKSRSVSLASVVLLAAMPALAEGQPAAKATAQVASLNVLAAAAANDFGQWNTILSNSLKTANQKDVFVDVTMECGLYTKTLVQSKGGQRSTAAAEGRVEVRVLIDGHVAEPGAVTFCQRRQELSATFQGLIDGCLSVDGEGNVVLDETCLQAEEVELIQETMIAAGYNFVSGDLSSGVHTIEVQARIELNSSAGSGAAEARAVLGKGSVTVEEVRLIKGEDYELY